MSATFNTGDLPRNTPVDGTSPATGDRRQFVVFSLDDQHYGLDIMSVREIRMMQQITYLPGAPAYVSGVINLRGSIVPVCDLRARFNAGKTAVSPGHAIVIVSIDNRAIGLLVDEVLDILSVQESDVCEVPEAPGTRCNHFFSGLATGPSGLMIILDLQRVLAPRGGEPEQLGALGGTMELRS